MDAPALVIFVIAILIIVWLAWRAHRWGRSALVVNRHTVARLGG